MAGPSYRPAIFFRYITGRFGRRASVAHPAPFRVERPFDSQLSGEDELQLLTDWVRSPMAALEHSSWQIVDLAGSPVRRNATGWIGSVV